MGRPCSTFVGATILEDARESLRLWTGVISTHQRTQMSCHACVSPDGFDESGILDRFRFMPNKHPRRPGEQGKGRRLMQAPQAPHSLFKRLVPTSCSDDHARHPSKIPLHGSARSILGRSRDDPQMQQDRSGSVAKIPVANNPRVPTG